MKRWQGLVQEFKEYLPVNEETPQITLNEGSTPLIYCEKLSEKLDIELYVNMKVPTLQDHLKIVAWLWRSLKLKNRVKDSDMCIYRKYISFSSGLCSASRFKSNSSYT